MLMAVVVVRVSFLISAQRTMLPTMQGSNGRYMAAILAARKQSTLVRFIDSRNVWTTITARDSSISLYSLHDEANSAYLNIEKLWDTNSEIELYRFEFLNFDFNFLQKRREMEIPIIKKRFL